MLKIRMQRTGRINTPSYRIVVIEHARATKAGNIVEAVGTYDPMTKVRTLKEDRVKYWMSVGAQPSATVHNMLVNLKIISGKKINVNPKKVLAKQEEPAAPEAAPEVPKAPEVTAMKDAPVAPDAAEAEEAPSKAATEEAAPQA